MRVSELLCQKLEARVPLDEIRRTCDLKVMVDEAWQEAALTGLYGLSTPWMFETLGHLTKNYTPHQSDPFVVEWVVQFWAVCFGGSITSPVGVWTTFTRVLSRTIQYWVLEFVIFQEVRRDPGAWCRKANFNTLWRATEKWMWNRLLDCGCDPHLCRPQGHEPDHFGEDNRHRRYEEVCAQYQGRRACRASCVAWLATCRKNPMLRRCVPRGVAQMVGRAMWARRFE